MTDLHETRSSWIAIAAAIGALAFGVGLFAGMYVSLVVACG